MRTTESPKVYGDVLALNIDMANDFARPTGTLYVNDAEQVIAPMNAINTWVRSQNGQTLFTQDWHPLGTKHFAVSGGNWPIHCVEDTYGAELHNDLIVRPEDLIVYGGIGKAARNWECFDKILESLKKLENKFSQIILISHLEEIKDLATNLIEIKALNREESEVRYY